MSEIALDEWMAELDRLTSAAARGPEGFTVADVCRATGLAHQTVGERVRLLVKAGLLQYVGKRQEKSVIGSVVHVPVYRAVRGRGKGRG